MDRRLDFWLFKKHVDHITILELEENLFRSKIAVKKGYHFYETNANRDTVFSWDKIVPSYNLNYDYVGIENDLSVFLKNTVLTKDQSILVETASGGPIIEVEVDYFIKNAWDFVRSSNGMGAVMATSDYDLVMEFTNDEEYLLFSNFKI